MVVILSSTMIIKAALFFLLGTVIVSGSPYRNGKSRPQYKAGRQLLPKRYMPSSEVVVSEIRKSNEDSLSIPVQNAHFGTIGTASRRNLKPIRKPEFASMVKKVRSKYNKNNQRVNAQIVPLEEMKDNEQLAVLSLPGTLRFEEPQVSLQSLPPLEFVEVPSLPELEKPPSVAFPELTVKQIRLPGRFASPSFANDKKTPLRIIKRPMSASPFNKPLPEVQENSDIHKLQDFELSKSPQQDLNSNQGNENLSSSSLFSIVNNEVEPCLTPALLEKHIVSVQQFDNPKLPLVLDNPQDSLILVSNEPELELFTVPQPSAVIVPEQPAASTLPLTDVTNQEVSEVYENPSFIPEAPKLPLIDLSKISVEAEVEDSQPVANKEHSSDMKKVLSENYENNLQPLLIPDAPQLQTLSVTEPQPETIVEETTLSILSTVIDQDLNPQPTKECLTAETITVSNSIPEAPKLSPLILSDILMEAGEMETMLTPEAEQSTEETSLLGDLTIPEAPELAPLTENVLPVAEILISPGFIPEAPKLPLPYLNDITVNAAAEELIPVSSFIRNEESHLLPEESMPAVNIGLMLTPHIPKLPPLSLPELPMKFTIEKQSSIALSEIKPVVHKPDSLKNAENLAIASEDVVSPNHLQSVIIPEAPTLSPFVMPKLPPLIMSESPIYSNKDTDILPQFSENLDKDLNQLITKNLPPLTLPEAPTQLLSKDPVNKSNIETETSQNPTSPKDHKLFVIPKAPELPGLTKPFVPVDIVIEGMGSNQLNSYDSGVVQRSDDSVSCEGSTFETETTPILIPQTPSLPPLALPERPLHLVTDELASSLSESTKNLNSDERPVSEINLTPIIIPHAPVLPPLNLSELPVKIDSYEKLSVPLSYELPPLNSINPELFSETLVLSKIPALPPLEFPASPHSLSQSVKVEDIEKDSNLIVTQKLPDTELKIMTVPKLLPLSLPIPVSISESIPSLPVQVSPEISSEVEIKNDKIQHILQIPEAPRLPEMNLPQSDENLFEFQSLIMPNTESLLIPEQMKPLSFQHSPLKWGTHGLDTSFDHRFNYESPEQLVHLSALKKPLEYETTLENLIASDHKQVSYPVLCAQDIVNKHVLPNIVLNRKFEDLKK